MYWLNLDSVPINPSSLFAAIPNFHESPNTRKFPGLVVHRAENVNDPWWWDTYWVRDDGSSSPNSNINSFPRVNLRAGVPGGIANYHRSYVRPAPSVDANGVTYTRKLSFGSTSEYTGGYGVVFTCDDTIAKNGIEPGATGNQTDFRTSFGFQAITLGEPTFIDRIRHHLCDLYRPFHFFTREGEVMDFSGSPFAHYQGNWVNLPNLNAFFSWGNPALNDTARLGKTVNLGDYDNVLNGVTPSSTVFPGVVEYDPPTVVWNSQTIATSSLIQKGVGIIQSATSSTSTIGGVPHYFLTITTDAPKVWATNELVGKQFVINQFTRFGHSVNVGNGWEVRNGVSSNTVSTIVLSALDPISIPAVGSNFYSDDINNHYISHQPFGPSLSGASVFHSRFAPKWRYYNDQHASNMLITCYVALTGDYMVEEDFEHLANMELALYRPWMGIPPGDPRTGLISTQGYGQFPGGGEREFGRRLLFFTNPMCVVKPNIAFKFHELCKILSDKVDAWFRSQTNNYTDYEKTCLQIGADGGTNDRNPVYAPTEDGVDPLTPVGIWAPWQMSYIIRGLYSFTKFNNDSKYRDLLLRFIRTLFLYGIFKEPEGQMPANRPGPGSTIAPLANRLWPNTWKLIGNIRLAGNFLPLPASSYYECDKLRLPTDGMSTNNSEGFWSRLRVQYSPAGFGDGRGCYKGSSPFDVSCALSGNSVISGISTEPLRSALTDFNRELFVDNGYVNWTFPAAQIAASIVKDSDEAGARYPFFSGVIQARENARDYINSVLFRSPNLNYSNNTKYGRRIAKYSPANFLEYWCYSPIPLTEANQYPFNSIQTKEMTSSGTDGGTGGETGNYSMQPTPTNGGWTVFTSSVDSRIVYVSDSSGNDANNGLSPATAKKSLGAGYALLRDGYPDWLLLARGDTFNYNGSGVSGLALTGNNTSWAKSGRSNDERMIFGAYGDESLPRPIIKMFNKTPIRTKVGNPSLYGTDASFTRNLNFVSLDFVSEFYPNFSGQGDADYVALDFTFGIRNFLMEDCSIHDTSEGMVIQSFGQGANQLSMVDTILDLRSPNSLAASTFSKNIKIYRCSFYNLQVSGSNRPTQTNNPRLQSIFATAVYDLIIEECVFDELFYSERIPNILDNIYSHHLYLADFCISPVVAKNIFSRSSAQGAKMTIGGYCARNLFMRNLIGVHAGGCGNVSYGDNQTITQPAPLIESPIGENSNNGVCFEWVNRQKVNFYANVSMDNRDLRFPSGVEQYGSEPFRTPGQIRQTYGWHYSTHGSREVVVYDNIAIGSNTSSSPYKSAGGVGLAIGGGVDDFFPRICHVVNNIFYNISGTGADSRVITLSHLGDREPIPGANHSELFSLIGNVIGFSSMPSPTGNVRAVYVDNGFKNLTNAMNLGGNIFQINKFQAAFTANAPTSVTQWWSRVGDYGSVIQTPVFPDPTRDLEKYQATIENPTGGLSRYDFFMKKARENRKGAWYPEYTSAPVIDYIREGFGKPKFF